MEILDTLRVIVLEIKRTINNKKREANLEPMTCLYTLGTVGERHYKSMEQTHSNILHFSIIV